MKHLENLFSEMAAKVNTNRVLASHYQLITQSMRKLYPDVDVMSIAIKALGGEPAKMIEKKEKRQILPQSEAVYAEIASDEVGCATCGGQMYNVPVVQEVEPEAKGLMIEENSNDDDLVEGFIRANDTESFFKFLKGKGAKVANKDAKNIDKLIAAYDSYKRG